MIMTYKQALKKKDVIALTALKLSKLVTDNAYQTATECNADYIYQSAVEYSIDLVKEFDYLSNNHSDIQYLINGDNYKTRVTEYRNFKLFDMVYINSTNAIGKIIDMWEENIARGDVRTDTDGVQSVTNLELLTDEHYNIPNVFIPGNYQNGNNGTMKIHVKDDGTHSTKRFFDAMREKAKILGMTIIES